MVSLTPQAFVDKWRHVELNERAACQEHFIDLCRLLNHPTPVEADPTGANFAFEYGAAKQAGGQGFADVFERSCFGWEYKGKHANLDKAYAQLLQYRSDLLNPPLLVVCDMDRIVVHTNFTNSVKQTRIITLDDLLKPDGLNTLRAIFERALLAVRDHGQGIPAEELDKLFKPFSRTSVLSTAGERSTGLGLTITRKIVMEHGGDLWVESEVGQGSTFFVALPVSGNTRNK